MSLPVAPVIVATEAHPPSARFLVGQDPQGFWVAVEVHGLAGGLFRTRRDAMHYAVDATERRADCVVVTAERIELRL